jgi:hypothetical protein
MFQLILRSAAAITFLVLIRPLLRHKAAIAEPAQRFEWNLGFFRGSRRPSGALPPASNRSPQNSHVRQTALLPRSDRARPLNSRPRHDGVQNRRPFSTFPRVVRNGRPQRSQNSSVSFGDGITDILAWRWHHLGFRKTNIRRSKPLEPSRLPIGDLRRLMSTSVSAERLAAGDQIQAPTFVW